VRSAIPERVAAVTAQGRPPAASERTRPKLVLLLRLLVALDEGVHGFEALKVRLDPERPPGTRSLRRYLATLAQADFPWYYDRASDSYRFEAGYSLRPLELSGADRLGLLTLRGVARSLGPHVGARIGRVGETLERVAGTHGSQANVIRVQGAGTDLDEATARAYETIERAQAGGQSVRFAYVDKRGAKSVRHVDPYGFVLSAGRIYLVGYDRTRGAKRTFALDNLEGPRADPSRFGVPAEFNIEAFAAHSISGTNDAAETTRVTVRFSASIARAASADRIVRDRRGGPRADGGVEIAYDVADVDELVRWSLGWGAEAEVTAPPAARARARAIVAALARAYASEPPA